MNSSRIRRLAVCGALSIVGVGALVSPAAAREPSEPTLQELCERRGGDFYDTPFDFGRCQEARPRKRQDDPLAQERQVCADTYGGTVNSSPSYNRPRRISWNCV